MKIRLSLFTLLIAASAKFPSPVPQFNFASTLPEQEAQLETNALMLRFAQSRSKLASDKHRPLYHFVSPESMLNDPNGLCFWQGRWHLFYQAYPPEDTRQHWGHTVSDDLIHWRDLPYAIYPSIERMCFSGSTVVEDKQVVAFYPGVDAGMMVAISRDPLLLNWEKISGNPVSQTTADSCIWKQGDAYLGLLSGGRLLSANQEIVPNAMEQTTTTATNHLLFAAEGMRRIVILARDGGILWEYPAEMSRDAWRLPNGNILFCFNNEYNSGRHDNPSGVMEVTPDKQVVFDFRTTGQVWSCQRLADGNTLVGAASQGKLLIVATNGVVARSIKLRGAPGHSCLRNARQIEGGRFLVAEEGSHAVREYASDGAFLSEIRLDFPPYSAVRLANGRTLACGQGKMIEADGDGKVVWSLLAADIPEMGVRWYAGIQVLPGGNILVCNAGGKVPFFEVNRQKEILWQWPASAPAMALGHGLQRLDVAGPLRR